jgi:putative N6-adenine-specific DNA methylase
VSFHRYYAACTLGLEKVLYDELRALGADNVEQRRGACSFTGDRAMGYAACLWLRSAVRVQEELIRGPAHDRDELYALARAVDWTQSITYLQTLAVDGSVRDSFANDTRFPGLVVKDAICDQMRERFGKRPNVEKDRPDLPVKLVLQGNEAILYRELGGAPLHKRGYREIQHKSPLNEATAAGLLLLTGWNRQTPLCDPMCGSATFLVEAAWLATDRAPGLGRSFAFERWKDVDVDAWRKLFDDAEARAQRGASKLPPICGNDRHPGAIAIAQQALAAAGLAGRIEVHQGDTAEFVPPTRPEMVVTNPPYGDRLQSDPVALEQSWSALGRFLHMQCQGATAWVLCGNADVTRLLGLRATEKLPVKNGPIDCRWLKYEVDERVRG